MTLAKSFQILRRALRGENHDYTQGSILEAIVLLSIPMILELGLESVFAVVDMFFVSSLGPNAIATVGLTEAVITIVYSIAMGISTGATAIVARRTGEKQPDAAALAGAQAILLAIVISVLISVIGVSFPGKILQFMGGSPEVIAHGAGFTRILVGGNLVILLLFLINGIFRGVGDAAMAMKSLWLASGVNIILCPVFIRQFGLEGAAMATVCGRGLGVLFQCFHLWKGDGSLRLLPRHFGLDIPIIRNLLKIAWPAAGQFIIGSGSWIFITKLVADTGGTAASAGCQIAFRIFVFFMLPAWGLSNAAATLMGQNLGAHRPDRAEQSVWITAKAAGAFMTAVMLIVFAFAGPAIGWFTQDAEVFAYGTQSLRIIAAGFVFFGCGMVLAQALNGAGDAKTPTRFNLICFWLFQTPVAYALVKWTNAQAMGALLAIPLAHALMVAIAAKYFKSGKWKRVQV